MRAGGSIACAAVLALAAAAPTTEATQRTVTLTLYGRGKALWKLESSRETARLSLRYRWYGTVRFAVAAPQLRDPRHQHLAAAGVATLVGSWSGRWKSTKPDGISTCAYRGAHVRAPVAGELAKGRSGNTIELRFHPRGSRRGFFDDSGRRALVRCSAGVMQPRPPHFAPSWFFRDNLQDHGRMTATTAVLVLPSTLLPEGTATIHFPREHGHNDSPFVGRLAWSNRAETAVRAR